MARTVVGYVPSGYLNSAASTVSSGSVDVESGLPIATGLTVGAFHEITDADALALQQPQRDHVSQHVVLGNLRVGST